MSDAPASSPDAAVTALLVDFAAGDQKARAALLEAVYGELHQMAERSLRHERAGHTIQPTALVHEAYLKLVDQSKADWKGRTHFQAVAAQAMRRVLIDYARGRKRQKRGGGWRQVTMSDALTPGAGLEFELLALQEAMERMHQLDERQARVVELRLYGGLSEADTARLLDVSTRTVERDWKMGLAWLRRELAEGDEP